MSTLLLVFLIFIALILLLLNFRKTSLVFLSSSFILFLLIGNGIIPEYLLKQLESPYAKPAALTWEKENAIILLGSGAVKPESNANVQPSALSYAGIYTTARLYENCKKTGNQCLIIISGGDALKTGSSEAMVYRQALLNLNIPNTAIAIEPNSMNTFENARFTRNLLQAKQFSQIVLVTSAVHLKRSLMYFSFFGIDAKPMAADYLTAYKRRWPNSANLFMTDLALHENLGILQFHVYNFLGWNKNMV